MGKHLLSKLSISQSQALNLRTVSQLTKLTDVLKKQIGLNWFQPDIVFPHIKNVCVSCCKGKLFTAAWWGSEHSSENVSRSDKKESKNKAKTQKNLWLCYTSARVISFLDYFIWNWLLSNNDLWLLYFTIKITYIFHLLEITTMNLTNWNTYFRLLCVQGLSCSSSFIWYSPEDYQQIEFQFCDLVYW